VIVTVRPPRRSVSRWPCILGTLDLPTSRRVVIDGYDVSRLSDRQLSALRAGRIGLVFQQFHLAAGVPAVEDLADGLLYAGVGPAQRRRRATAILERIGLGHRLDTSRTGCPVARSNGWPSPGR
jgi:putative ABC transport system ATP-binding protein